MTATDIAAFIGAGAWVPQIVTWVAGQFAKPRLRLVSGPTAEIGYTTFGPIVNLTASFSAEGMDALIEKVTLKAVHEKGEERLLVWKWLNETQHQIRVPTTGATAAEVVRNQPAVALKVSTLSQIDRIIGFQDLEFEAASRRIIAELRQHYDYLKGATPVGDVVDALISSKEFVGARDWFADNMYWKEGQYRFEVALHEVRLRSPHTERFKVIVSRADVERLRTNAGQFESFVRASLLASEGVTTGIAWPSWNWSYCEVAKLT